ncbi:putative aminopeptidase W07G4.4 isoform X1 [Anastrepha obliqua]|uniref:putative aminopeptidase W07G4.4 isoform X1 n=1 Tax=Anastrepha obliqua TaxID=95512 RepID=UPI002409F7D6|nr:putative aminopeptidase W07G4.4 isoform X1 [Anastrepha obliqua]
MNTTLDELLPCSVKIAKQIQKTKCDVVCIIDRQVPTELAELFNEFRTFDQAFDSVVSCFKSHKLDLPIVYSPVQELTDYHDVRTYQKAAAKSMERAIKAGFESPMLVVPTSQRFSNSELCTVLGALDQLYVPIQLREDKPAEARRIKELSVLIDTPKAESILKEALVLESGRRIARDIGVGDPERMSPLRVEVYVNNVLSSMNMQIVQDVYELQEEYPLFAAVNRAANQVLRHRGCIIFLEYVPPKPARKTLMLVGKGVTYDTGGADIKAGGVMAGMSRDKCGAAAVAGFMQIVNEKKPDDVHVMAALCMVRNSVGEESYVSDEIITSRAGVRIRVGNTDAEGRMCMADALCLFKEKAVVGKLPDPHLFTIATLTGHACISAGDGYSIAIDNSVAHKAGHARLLQETGQSFGEPFEVSVLRPDDFDFNKGKVIGEDIVQANNAPSTRTPRGHQIPAAFLIQATGLDKHGVDSKFPIKYTHIDIAGSACVFPEMPTGAPIVALAKTHLDT